MPSITLIPATRLKTGEESGLVVFTPVGSDALVLRLSTTQIGSKASQATLYVRSDEGQNLGSVLCNDGEDKRLTVDGHPDGQVTVQVVCNLGESLVDVAELTGLDATVPEASVTSDLPAATRPDYMLMVGVGSGGQALADDVTLFITSTVASRGDSIVNLGAGQIQLAPGRTYKLTSHINTGSGSASFDFASFFWYDQTAGPPGVQIPEGARGLIADGGSENTSSSQGTAIAYITPSATTVVALVVLSGSTGGSPNINLNTSSVLVEEV